MEDLMMHGRDYAGQDVAGWIATEKLDGCRARELHDRIAMIADRAKDSRQ